jgi:hypothetical protein
VRIPLVQDYWIGRTFVHVAHDAPAAAPPPGIELRAMVPQDILRRLLSRTIPSCADAMHRWALASAGLAPGRGGRLVGVCTFAFGEEYHGYYRLRAGEAELTDIFTTTECRGKGAATPL